MFLDKSGGYVALFSALIISAVLLGVVAAGSSMGFFTRLDILDSEIKEKSYALAEACIHTALLKLSVDEDLSAGETVTVDGFVTPPETCSIRAYSGTGAIESEAVYRNSYTNLQVTFDADYNILTWTEVASF